MAYLDIQNNTSMFVNNTTVDMEYICNTSISYCGRLRLNQGPNLEYLFNGLLIPIIASFGVVGNLLNLAILSWRCNSREVSEVERGALLGLVALAVSDLCFCLAILPNLLFYDSKSMFSSKGFHYYYQLYGTYFNNVFIKVSTWLTVVIATARYIAICHPLKARVLTGLFTTKMMIVVTYVVWILMMSPLMWSYVTHTVNIPPVNNTWYILDLGYLPTQDILKFSFTYIGALTGYFIPVAILTFCNIKLILALRRARRWRENSAKNAPTAANERITLTLVALVLMFLALVSPSELLHFYTETKQPDTYPSLQLAMWCTNLLQAINFSCHFLLYCIVNATFRRTMTRMCDGVFRRYQPVANHTELHYMPSNSTRLQSS